MPIGILRVLEEINYLGIDVHKESIDWCKRYIEQDHPSFKFKHLNIYNERYNKNGSKIDDNFRFELESESVDIIYLFSVFSHTIEEDMRAYLRDCSRILDKNGRMVFTTFVEDNVPDISINAENYRVKCSGPLHAVRYDRDYLFSILDEFKFSILNFTHGTETAGQSAIYLGKKNG